MHRATAGCTYIVVAQACNSRDVVVRGGEHYGCDDCVRGWVSTVYVAMGCSCRY